MKRKLNSVYLLFAVLLIAFFQMSNSGNPPNGYTGAPPSGNTCASSQGGCHAGGSGSGNVSITGLPAQVMPNVVYPLTVTITRTNNFPQAAGFQLVAQQIGNNSNAGVLNNPGPFSTVQFTGNKYFFEQTSPQGFVNDMVSFTVDWTAPTSSNGDIRLYSAANLVDLSGNTSGDAVITTTATTTLVGGGGPITVIVSGTNVNCFGGNNGSATATASGGGGGPYTYAWSNGGSGSTINNLTAGTYTVTVTNAVGGSGTGSVNITQPPQLTVNTVNQTDISCLIPTGSATVQANGGSPSYTFAWSNGQSGATATNLSAGTYTVSVTDSHNCVATGSVNINSNTIPPIAEAGPPAQITCTVSSPTLNGSGSSSGGGYSYLWTTTNGFIVSGATTLTPTVNSAGTYVLTVTNAANGCTASDLTTVTTNNTPPTSNAGPDGLLNCNVTSLQLNGNSSSQGAEFTYLWTTADGHITSGTNTLVITVDAPGTYCLKVTNTINGCTATDCASVTQNITPPVANAGSAPPITCTTLQVTLDGSASSQGGNYSYLWTTANGHIVSGATTLTPVVDVAAVYTLKVTNSTNGCTATSNVTVASNTTLPTANAGPNRALNCNNSSVVLDGSGSSQGPNFTYAWTGPGIQSGGNTPNPTVNEPGTYVILVTNTTSGCAKSDTALVTQTPALSASISASQNLACNGANTGSATVAATGGNGAYTYAWSNNATTAQITNLAAGTYTATVTDADNCTSTASVNITQPPALNANATATGETSVGANNGTATAAPSGGVPTYTYLWSTGATSQTINGLSPGNYTVSVTDANNCTTSQTVTVASFSCAGVGVNIASVNPSCNGGNDGSATATVTGSTGPYHYTWSNGDTTNLTSNLSAGSYTVSIEDGSGCNVTGNVTLVAPAALSLSLQQTNVACNGETTGMATVNASGGTPGYTYNWSNGGSGASQNNMPAGTYTASVTDENDCLATIQVVISQPPALAGTLTASGESGVGANDGTVSVAMSGGVAPYAYLWSNGATTSAITGLVPGSYCVSVTDANGCVFNSCATVIPFGCIGLNLGVSNENVSCFGGNDGSAQVAAVGFEAPITYTWKNSDGENVGTGSSVGGLSSGIYTINVTDGNGCTGSETVEITEPTALSIENLAQNNLECAGGSDGSIAVDGKGGTPAYAFSWSNGATTPTVSGLIAGIYEVIVSDANNCTATMSFEITVLPDTEAPTPVANNVTIGLGSNGVASITADMLDGGSTDNCSIASLSLDKTDFDCGQIGENTVTLTVTDAAGNASNATAIVTVTDEIPPVITCPQSTTVDNGSCAPTVDYAEPTATDNCGAPVISLVSGLASGDVFPGGATTVTWLADDGNGNTATCSFTVTVVSDFSVSTSFAMPSCTGDSNGTATATASGGIAPFTYAWDDTANQTTQTATGLSAGTYSVSVTDAQGCMASQTVDVTEPAPVQIIVDEVHESDGSSNGYINVTASGGAGGYGYEWQYNGSFFSNDEDLTDLTEGDYNLIVTDQNGCSVQELVIVDLLNGSTEQALEQSVTVSPNPSSGLVFVGFKLRKEMPVNLQVFNLAGRPLLPLQTATISNKTIELDLTGFASGVYFIRIIVDGSVVVKRLVVGR